MKICLHQWMRPKGPYVKVEGVGNCTECTPHEDNKNCIKYCPINVTIYDERE